MNLRQHENRDGYKVWLSSEEIDQLIGAAPNASAEIALALAARCGLRGSYSPEAHRRERQKVDWL